jgi:hypothetical protein
LSSRLLPARRTFAHWIAAAFAAAAIVYLPILVILLTVGAIESARQTVLWVALALVGTAAIAVHIRISPFPLGAQLAAIAIASTLAVVAGIGVLFMVLAGGSCSDSGHLQLGGWISAVALYVGLATWGLQRPRRTAWAVPVALLVAGLWLVTLATVTTGSTGACLD